jgi:acetyl-CoA acetyltransferase
MREVTIIGAGMIPFGKTPDYPAARMGGDAVEMALKQAGFPPTWIQATFIGNISNPPNLAQRINGETRLRFGCRH